MSGAHEAAASFQLALLAGEERAVWNMLTPEYQRVLIARWIKALGVKLDADEVADKLFDTEDREWLAWMSRTLASNFPSDPTGWGWAMRPRPVTLDTELVLFVDTRGVAFDANGLVQDGTVVNAVQIYMRLADPDGWRVAGLNELAKVA